MRDLQWQSNAWEEYLDLLRDKEGIKKINQLLKDLMRNGYNTTYGKIEMLKGDYSGFASVRIDKKNRLIFRVEESRVIIIACGSHYSDH